MVVTCENSYDRTSELIAFDGTKAGVKGLVDAGVTRVPRIFYTPEDAYTESYNDPEKSEINIPIIDLDGIGKDPIKRSAIVEKIRDASEVWGFLKDETRSRSLELGSHLFVLCDRSSSSAIAKFAWPLIRKRIALSTFAVKKSGPGQWEDLLYVVQWYTLANRYPRSC
nr:1-aminocyclopropane-1-carboxylate oxidase homolog [Nicotiana tomentosiformis]